ncbi:MAG TPA: molybdenum cofactor biosynthesis protein MoaE [Candidatus Acidoferrales bacterium]|nr:molybdenum cofactor biosynthesis protein MoaE [Candidatus Acidoferrales bacterium]
MKPVRVRVLFFGQLREIVGWEAGQEDLEPGASVQDLFAAYSIRFPQLAALRGSIAPAVNQELAGWQAPLAAGDEVAFLPPVSGGCGAPAAAGEEICELLRRPVARDEWVAQAPGPADGAVVVFEGVARNHSRGRRVVRLEYEGYEPMAGRKMRQLAAELRRRFPVSRVVLVHRLGRIGIGETSILIAVSSAHRQAAFDACRHAIDAFKRTVPIWKKEFFEDGEAWAAGERPDAPAR